MSAAENKVGFVIRVGWVTNDEGVEVFQAVVEYPDGPPEGLTFGTIWKEKPVEIRELAP